MGIVYKAVDPTLSRTVAIKGVSVSASKEMGEDTGRFRLRLEREAMTHARLEHPSVAHVYALIHEEDAAYIVMQYIEGRTLRDLLDDRAAGTRDLISYCAGIAAALEAAHSSGIVHRDLKPSNVMIADQGEGQERVKVLDFGIAWREEPDGEPCHDAGVELEAGQEGHRRRPSQGTATVGGAGTPRYMSPEQMLGLPVDPRSDIWAFGRILEDCLDAGANALSDGTRSPDRCGKKDPELPAATRQRLNRLASWCRQPLPHDRPESMRRVREELTSILDSSEGFGPRTRRRTLVAAVAAGAVLAGGWAGGRALLERLAGPGRPIAVDARGTSVLVRTDRGRSLVFAVPDSINERADTAAVLLGGSPPARFVVGWRREDVDTERIFVWNARGRLLEAIRPTQDTPFSPPDPMLGAKRVMALYQPSPALPYLSLIEFSHYYPSTIRCFSLAPEGIEEKARLYHAGHIDKFFAVPGHGRQPATIWISGFVSNHGGLREAAGGVPGNTQFLACLDARELRGTTYLPSFITPDPAFLRGHPEPVRLASVIFYLVVRGYLGTVASSEGTISRLARHDARAIRIESVVPSETGTTVLLTDGLRLDFEEVGPRRLQVTATAGPVATRLLQERAERASSPTDPSAIARRFLADSVLALAEAEAGWEIAGDLRDIRDRIRSLQRTSR